MKRLLLLLSIILFSVTSTFSQKKIVGGYFTNWGVYGGKFYVNSLPVDKITQVTQAFMYPFVVDGALKIGDPVVFRGTAKKADILTCEVFTDDNGKIRTTGVASSDLWADLGLKFNDKGGYGNATYIDINWKPDYLVSESEYNKLGKNGKEIVAWLAKDMYERPGVLGQMALIKEIHGIEIIASLGGWTLAQHFPHIANDIKTREAFAEAVYRFAKLFRFDGIDLDWEFPVKGGTDGSETIESHTVPSQPHFPEDPMNMVMLCKALKQKFGNEIHLAACTNQNPHNVAQKYIFPGNQSNWAGQTYKGYDGSNLNDWLDYFYTMTYDYGGRWLKRSSHQAPLYDSNHPDDPDKDMSVSTFINMLIDVLKVPPSKVIMGLPFYGRGWSKIAPGPNGDGLYQLQDEKDETVLRGSMDNVVGENSASFTYGDLKQGTTPNKHKYIKDGPGTGNEGFIEYWDDDTKTPYLYNSSTGHFISYDNPKSVAEKVRFAMSKKLAGVFTWEYSQDDSNFSLLTAMYENTKVFNVNLSGDIKTSNNQGISGVDINISKGNNYSTQSDNIGSFSQEIQALLEYDVKLSKSGYTFLPNNFSIKNLTKDTIINIIGSQNNYNISGNLSQFDDEVLVELYNTKNNDLIKSIKPDNSGNYTFSNLPSGFDYKIKINSNYYTSSPTQIEITNLNTNQINQDFNLSISQYSISGYVYNKDGNPISGSTINISNGKTEIQNSDSNGFYEFSNLEAKKNYTINIKIEETYFSTNIINIEKLDKNKQIDFNEYPGLAVFGFVKKGSTPTNGKEVKLSAEWMQGKTTSKAAVSNSDGFYFIEQDIDIKKLGIYSILCQDYKALNTIPDTLKESLKLDFNTESIQINQSFTLPSSYTAYTNSDGKITFLVNVTPNSGTVESVKFRINEKTYTSNNSNNNYELVWTPETLYEEHEIEVITTLDSGQKDILKKSFYIDCNNNCPNMEPTIKFVTPSSNNIVQKTFEPINLQVQLEDNDGTIESYSIEMNGTIVKQEKSINSNQKLINYNFTPTEYKIYTFTIRCSDNESSTKELTKSYKLIENSRFTELPTPSIVGYWENANFSAVNGQRVNMRLSEIKNTKFNVVQVAFAVTDNNSYTLKFTPDPSLYPNPEDFKTDVNLLKENNIPVILSLGGELGHVKINTESEKEAFVTSLISVMDEWGFDGFDLDLEKESAKFGETSKNLEYENLESVRLKILIDAVREISAHYNHDIIITAAPEVYYVQLAELQYPTYGDFIPLMYNCFDEIDLLHVQYYNYGSHWWASPPMPTGSAEFVVQELERLLIGFTVSNTNTEFPPIPGDKLAVGLPAVNGAAGVPNEADYNVDFNKMIEGFEYMRTGIKPQDFQYDLKAGPYPELFRGMMTWSVQWDASTNHGHTPFDFSTIYFNYFSQYTNHAPSISIVSPINNQKLELGDIEFNINANDTDGSIASIEFFLNDVQINTLNSAPFTISHNINSSGIYKFYAKATDNEGKSTKTDIISIQLYEKGAPEIRITSHQDGQKILPNEQVIIKADASDSDGSISKVQFFNGSNLIVEDTQSPYEYNYTSIPYGESTIKAVATDNTGKTTSSESIKVFRHKYIEITGTVTKPNGDPVENVILNISNYNSVGNILTNSKGEYTINNVISDRDYTITPAANDLNFEPGSIELNDINTNQSNINFNTFEGVIIHGFVLNDQSPIASAMITIILDWVSNDAGYKSIDLKTDADGYYKYTIPEAYVNQKKISVKMYDYNNNSQTYYPEKEGYVFDKITNSTRCDFNSLKIEIDLQMTNFELITADLNESIELTASASIPKSTIEKLEFIIDNQTINATSSDKINWIGNWTPSETNKTFELTIIATSGDTSKELKKEIEIRCIGNNCPNKKPYIVLNSPTESKIFQTNFEKVNLVIEADDYDGYITSLEVKVDNKIIPNTKDNKLYYANFTPTEFKTHIIEFKAIDNNNEVTIVQKEITISEDLEFTALPDVAIVGYWHNWNDNRCPFISLADMVNTKYTVIQVAFGIGKLLPDDTRSESIVEFIPDPSKYKTAQSFRDEVQVCKDAKIPVILSLGGEHSQFHLYTEDDRNDFVNSLINIVDTYGFDGIDIDFEKSAMRFGETSESLEFETLTSERGKNLILAIKELAAYYGDKFIFTAAPELAYMQAAIWGYPLEAQGDFLPIYYNCQKEFQLIHPQFYNYGSTWWMGGSNSYTAPSLPSIFQQLELLLTGFPLGTTGKNFAPLPGSKLAVGLPATNLAAGGNTNNFSMNIDKMIEAFEYFRTGLNKPENFDYTLKAGPYPELIRGMMTWSINWDASTDDGHIPYSFSDKYFEYFSKILNKSPDINITSPLNNDIFGIEQININVDAIDNDGSIDRVEFYIGDKLISTDKSLPYTYDWNPNNAGVYNIKCIAFDNKGKSSESQKLTLHIVEQGTPEVRITSPSSNQIIKPNENVILKAEANDSDGTIQKVEFYDINGLLGTSVNSPYQYLWTSANSGKQSVYAKAYDDENKVATSSSIEFTIQKKYFISGKVVNNQNEGIPNIELSITENPSYSTVTDQNGNYKFMDVLSNSNYTITPINTSETFTPENIHISNLSENTQLNDNFVKEEGVYIYGYAKDKDTPYENFPLLVVLNWSSNEYGYKTITETTDANGYYKIFIPTPYVDGGKGGAIKIHPDNAWKYPDVKIFGQNTFSSFVKPTMVNFNTTENSLNILNTSNTNYDISSTESVKLTANANLVYGKMDFVNFVIGSEIISASLDAGEWSAIWKPTELNRSFEIIAKASGEGFTEEDSKTININCTGSGCGNTPPEISFILPNTDIEAQSTFSQIPIKIEATDSDGSVSSVIFEIDGKTYSTNLTGSYYIGSFIPTSYKTYTIKATVIDDALLETSVSKDYTVRPPSNYTDIPEWVIGGYYSLTKSNSIQPNLKLNSLVNSKFNLIILDNADFSSANNVNFDISAGPYQNNKTELKNDIKNLQDKNIPILLSLTDNSEFLNLSDQTNLNNYVNSIINIITEYSLDGIDINFSNIYEKYSFPTSSWNEQDITNAILKNFITAIKQIELGLGADLIICFSSNPNHIQAGFNKYTAGYGAALIVLENLKSNIDLINLNIYNSENQKALNNISYSNGTSDYLLSMSDMILSGFNTSTGLAFNKFEESKFILGVSATNSIVNNGYIDHSLVTEAIKYIENAASYNTSTNPDINYRLSRQDFNNIRGIGIYDINNDANNSYIHSEKYYEYRYGINDTEAPIIEVFSIPSSTTSSQINILAKAKDNIAITHYIITENNTTPDLSDPNWQTTIPTNYTLANLGIFDLYFWAKDEAENISNYATAKVNYEQEDNESPTIELLQFLSITNEGTVSFRIVVTDNVGVTGYLLKIDDNSSPTSSDDWKNSVNDINTYTFTGYGSYNLYFHFKDAKDNTSVQLVNVSYTDSENPVFNNLTADRDPNISNKYNLNYNPTDNVGIDKYIIKINDSNKPDSNDPNWTQTKPTSYSFTNYNTYTLSIWVMDKEENYASQSININFNDITEPTVSTFTNTNISKLGLASLSIDASDDSNIISGYLLNLNTTQKPLESDTRWTTNKPSEIQLPFFGEFDLYLWVKDKEGNMTSSNIKLNYTDVYAPSITEFSAPVISNNKNVPITIKTDDNDIKAYFISEDQTTPTTNSKWLLTKPTEISLTKLNTNVFYLWLIDEANNISQPESISVDFLDIDPPTIHLFSSVANTSIAEVDLNIVASDNFMIDGYYISESSNQPNSFTTWLTAKPEKYTLTNPSTTLYLWIKDTNGNISQPKSFTIVFGDTQKPVITNFSIPTTTNNPTIQVDIDGNDDTGITGYFLSTSNTTPLSNTDGWTFPKPTTYYLSDLGIQNIYLWVKDASGNISDLSSAQTDFSDNEAPIISKFDFVSETDNNILALDISANDNNSISGYYISFSSTTPDISSSGWNLIAPTNIVLPSLGIHDIYLWVKDESNNISNPMTGQVNYKDNTPPKIKLFNVPSFTEFAKIQIEIKSDDQDIKGYYISLDPTTPTSSSSWLATAPTEFTLTDLKTYTLYAWIIDNNNNISNVNSKQVTYIDQKPPINTKLSGTIDNNNGIISLDIEYTDNHGVARYMLKDSDSTPTLFSPEWTINPTTTYLLNTYQEITLYSWAIDINGNISDMTQLKFIYEDKIKPTIQKFDGPSISGEKTISIEISASDNHSNIRYYMQEGDANPDFNSVVWLNSPPTNFTFNKLGQSKLKLWVIDDNNNISLPAEYTTSFNDVTPPTITKFTTPNSSVADPLIQLDIATEDNFEVSDYYLSEDQSTNPSLIASSDWLGVKPNNYNLVNQGQTTVYLWVKDKAGNISSRSEINLEYFPTGSMKITNFTTNASSNIPTIDIDISTTGVVDSYLLSESSTLPSSGWVNSRPLTYTFNSAGNKTLYLWIKNSVETISTPSSLNVNVEDIEDPEIISFNLPEASFDSNISFDIELRDNFNDISYILNESSIKPSLSDSWTPYNQSNKQINLNLSTDKTYTYYLWVNDGSGNIVSINKSITKGNSFKIIVNKVTTTKSQYLNEHPEIIIEATSNENITSIVVSDEEGNEDIVNITAATSITYQYIDNKLPKKGSTNFVRKIKAMGINGNISNEVSVQYNFISTTKPKIKNVTIVESGDSYNIDFDIESFSSTNVNHYLININNQTLDPKEYNNYINGGNLLTDQVTTKLNLIDGENTISIYVYDNYNNISDVFSTKITTSIDNSFSIKSLTPDSNNDSQVISWYEVIIEHTSPNEFEYIINEDNIQPETNDSEWRKIPSNNRIFKYGDFNGLRTYYLWVKGIDNTIKKHSFDQNKRFFSDSTTKLFLNKLSRNITELNFDISNNSYSTIICSYISSSKTAPYIPSFDPQEDNTEGWYEGLVTSIKTDKTSALNYYVWAFNREGEISDMLTIPVDLTDNQKPTINIDNNIVLNNQDITFTVNIEDNYIIESYTISAYGFDDTNPYKFELDRFVQSHTAKHNLILNPLVNSIFISAKDKAGNIENFSYSLKQVDNIAPTINVFDAVYPSPTINIPLTIEAFDYSGIKSYYLSTDNTTPSGGELSWTTTKPESIKANTTDEFYAYLWVQDLNNNISNRHSLKLKYEDNTPPVITKFDANINPYKDFSAILNLEYTDKESVEYYYISEDETTPDPYSQNWEKSLSLEYSLKKYGVTNIYIWLKDFHGNISNRADATVKYLEKIAPIITVFNVNKSSKEKELLLDITVQENDHIQAYYIAQGIVDLPNDAVWLSTKPLIYTIKEYGDIKLKLWVRDQSGNISIGKEVSTNITDTEKPKIVRFYSPPINESGIAELDILATDNDDIKSYYISTSNTIPSNAIWEENKPTNHSFTSLGVNTLYLWVKDLSGNISDLSSIQITFEDKKGPVITNLTHNYISNTSYSVSFDVNDNFDTNINNFIISLDGNTPLSNDSRWTATKPDKINFTEIGETFYYIWAKDNSDNISATIFSKINVKDTEKPIVENFTIARQIDNYNIEIEFDITDNFSTEGIEYYLAESSTLPENAAWLKSKPSKYYTTTQGKFYLYIWAKDNSDNLSVVKITEGQIFDITKPVIKNFNATPITYNGNVNLDISVEDNVISEDLVYLLSVDENANTNSATWLNNIPSSYNTKKLGSNRLFLWSKDPSNNISDKELAEFIFIDNEKPNINKFETSPTANNNDVSYKISANDKITETSKLQYLCTDDNTTPHKDDPSWSTSNEGNYTISGSIEITLYAFVKDETGNISNPSSTKVSINDGIAPVITKFESVSESELELISLDIEVTDQQSVIMYYISEQNLKPSNSDPAWLNTKPTEFTLSKFGINSIYLWTMDNSLNISNYASIDVKLKDIEAPTINSVNSPSTVNNPSFDIVIDATDNNTDGDIYYLVQDVSDAPANDDPNWRKTSTYNFKMTGSGNQTLYVYAMDEQNNISSAVLKSVFVPDTDPPIISSVVMAFIYQGKDVPITINASDNYNRLEYYLSEDNSTPDENSSWLSTEPSSFVFSNFGKNTVYVWVRDLSGNISNMKYSQVDILDNEKPVLKSFTCDAQTSSSNVNLSIEASDNDYIYAYYISESDFEPDLNSNNWLFESPNSYQLKKFGESTLYLWVRDKAGLTDGPLQATTTYEDKNAPEISLFEAVSFTIEPEIDLTISASDDFKLNAYFISLSEETPKIEDANWSVVKPTKYFFENKGRHIIYLWVKDDAGNISERKSIQVDYGSSTSVEKIEKDFEIFPNPANDHIYVKSEINSEYAIIGVSGNIIKTGEIRQGNNKLNIQKLAQGIYFIRIKEDKNYKYKKFIKN
ncbi:MAG: glycosyl hydrolase family 18 protein [Marinifilaceae bacterium]|nr:glycosyl hydrolase family 18 protein [Marinifilaceae bacterium]